LVSVGAVCAAFPARTVVSSWKVAEAVSARWVRWLGHPDAQVTASGADGGLDLISGSAAGQVKFHARPVGRPALQGLRGAALSAEHQLYFFSSAGFTRAALEYGELVRMACFQLNNDGSVIPLTTEAARRYRAAAANRAGDPTWVDPADAAATALFVARVLLVGVAALGFGTFMIFSESIEEGSFLAGVLAVSVFGALLLLYLLRDE
jgi:hypothetical protein